MAKVRKLRLDVDLKDLFGVPIRDAALRQAIAGRIIDQIRDRTQSQNVDKDGRPFKKYSDRYKESLAFNVFGKSDNVDMTLSGNMLADMTVLEENANRVTIGFSDPTQNAKAFNHTTGDTVPRRDFFGIQKKELAQIKREFEDQVSSQTRGEERFDVASLFRRQELTDVIGRLLQENLGDE